MAQRHLTWIPVSIFGLAVLGAQAPRSHELPLLPKNVHWGYYDARVAPALHMASGERVTVETMVAGGLQRVRMAGVAEGEIPASMKAVE